MTTAYDVIRYPSWPVPDTHPAHLGVFATLYGLPHAPFDRCRVLEIGCGEGVNLMAMAIVAPNAEFVGTDLAETAIARGRETARAAGLANVTLEACDLLETEGDLGQFDYVIAHGLYAWVPEPVRKAALKLVGRSLGPDGLAFLSYNAYPGCRLREVLRDLLLDATRGIEDFGEKLETAHALLHRQIGLWSEAEPFQHALIVEARDMLKRPPEVLFHDELGAIYAPQRLGDVVAAAQEENLDYVCDAKPELSAEALQPSAEFECALPWTGGDWARYEQLDDDTVIRHFRRSIFCRAGRVIDRRFVAERLPGLWACAEIELLKREPEGFVLRAGTGAEFSTPDRWLVDLLVALGRAYPRSLPLSELATNPEIAGALIRLFVSNIVTLSTSPSCFAVNPGERPVASPLARAQAAAGETHLASLRHKPVKMEDATSRAFVMLMDGTRTLADLARDLASRTGATPKAIAEHMPKVLAEMARQGLLVG